MAVLGANGTGKSHFLRLLARGGTDPDAGQRAGRRRGALAPVAHDGVARLGARVRPGHFSQTHDRPELMRTTLVEILWRGDDHRAGMDRHAAMEALNRYELAGAGRPALRHALRRAAGAVPGAAAGAVRGDPAAARRADRQPRPGLAPRRWRTGLAAFEGTVIAVTHDRWFTRSFDRFVLFGGDGEVVETPEPVWDVPVTAAPRAGRPRPA